MRQAKESGRLNPRRAARDLATGGWEQVLTDNEQAVAEARSMAHTVSHSIENVVEWEPAFRDRWLPLLRDAGEAITAADPAQIGRVRSALGRLTDDLSDADLSSRHWPEYGAHHLEPAQRRDVYGPGRRPRAAPTPALRNSAASAVATLGVLLPVVVARQQSPGMPQAVVGECRAGGIHPCGTMHASARVGR